MRQIPSIKTRQRFKATPQLRNAIRLLQLSGSELQLEIQQAIETNALLEIENNNPQQFVDEVVDTNAQPYNESIRSDSDWPNDTRIEDQDDLYAGEDSGIDRYWLPAHERSDIDRSRVDAYEVADHSASLSDHLTQQIDFASLTVVQDAIAQAIIDSINADGMLQNSLVEIAASLRPVVNASLVEMEKVLKVIQDLDPPGVGARNLQECLLIQLRLLPKDSDSQRVATQVLANHFEFLASQDFDRLSRILNIPTKDLLEAVDLVRSLNPRPGSAIDSALTEYVTPDVIVREDNGRWLVELNPDVTPRVRINPIYDQPSTTSTKFRSNDYVRENLRNAKLFLQGVEHRNSTLANVSRCIVEHQHGFLEQGLSAMKPLSLANISSKLDIHVSTVSRITTRKYLLTPRGLFPLKYFFSKTISTTDGEPVASIAVQELIRNIIDREEKQDPLSDNSISKLLASDGMKIARRTVTKYREIMAIPTSNKRKKHYWALGIQVRRNKMGGSKSTER